MKFATIAALSLAAGALAAPASAAVVAVESFNYPAGNLAGQNGGSGFSAAYTASGSPGAQVVSPGLTFSTLATAGNAASTNGSAAAANQGAFRDLSGGTFGTDGTTVFVGFLARVPGTLPNYAGISLFQGGTENLFLGKPTGTTNYGFDRSGVTGLEGNSGVAADATTRFLVYQIDFGAGTTAGNEAIRLYVDPVPGAVAPLPATAAATNTDIGSFTFNRVRLQSGDQPMQFDEVRVGTTFADVAPVPEPATVGLAGVAAGGLLARRRRRQTA